MSFMFKFKAAEARTKPLFQSITASASISSLFIRCFSSGRSILFATMTIGGRLVRLVLRAASAAEMLERRELSAVVAAEQEKEEEEEE